MVGLIAILALIQNALPELDLPLLKAVPISDQASSALPGVNRRDIRGCVVADDGSAIFWQGDHVFRLEPSASTAENISIYVRKWTSADVPATLKQKAAMEAAPGFDKSKQGFEEVGYPDVISAKDKDSILLGYGFHPSGDDYYLQAIAELSLAKSELSANWIIYMPKGSEFSKDAVADLSSTALLASNYKIENKSYYGDGYRIVGTQTPIKANIVPGIVPFVYDSAEDLIVCFTFTEEGTPYTLLALHTKTDVRDRVAGIGGRVGVSGLLPKGRIVETLLPFRDSDGYEGKKFGLYECVPPYTAAKYLGPYRLVGSSRNGQWLLVSHLKTNKTWLISPKL